MDLVYNYIINNIFLLKKLFINSQNYFKLTLLCSKGAVTLFPDLLF